MSVNIKFQDPAFAEMATLLPNEYRQYIPGIPAFAGMTMLLPNECRQYNSGFAFLFNFP